MEQDEKITEIIKMFHKAIAGIGEIIKRPEHKSILFCLPINDKIVGVDIQKSFIDDRTIDEIKAYFSERQIYPSILSNSEIKMSDHEGIFIHIDDPICLDML